MIKFDDLTLEEKEEYFKFKNSKCFPRFKVALGEFLQKHKEIDIEEVKNMFISIFKF